MKKSLKRDIKIIRIYQPDILYNIKIKKAIKNNFYL